VWQPNLDIQQLLPRGGAYRAGRGRSGGGCGASGGGVCVGYVRGWDGPDGGLGRFFPDRFLWMIMHRFGRVC